MKALKRLALKALLSKEQRNVILNSVAYSEHKYRMHGDVDGAIRVGVIRKELENVITVPEPKFTKTQVDNIIKAVLCDFVDWLHRQSAKKATCVAVGTVVEKEKCDKCEHRDECEINKALFHDDEDKGKSAEGEDTANAQENDENAHPECGNAECDKTCPANVEDCPTYIRPTEEGDQPGAPEGECDTIGTQAAAEKIAEEQEGQKKSEE